MGTNQSAEEAYRSGRTIFRPGENCWRVERAGRVAVIVDAADYFHLAREALLLAKSQVLLIGWDFDTRIFLDAECDDDAPGTLGPLLTWLARRRPDLSIHILNWDLGALKLFGRGSTIFRLARWAMSSQINFKLDGAHPAGASHHQKIVVIDDSLAFCGGIDMTATRWDTREHLDDDKRRKRPTTGRHYRPWHDATMAVDGDAARALGELARDRWQRAGGEPIAAPACVADPWPEALKPQFTDVSVAISRTRGAYGDDEEIREIEALYVDMINSARRFVFAENQFFASRAIADAIERRLAEPDGPEFVIVNPSSAEGFIESEAMDPARALLLKRLRAVDSRGRLRIYAPVTQGGKDIYVHSKITIVDDRQLRVGSANINNRSMGLDSECDLLIDAAAERNAGVEAQIAALRCDLLAEHLGVAPERVAAEFAASQSLIATVEALRGAGRTLIPLAIKEPNEIEAALAECELLDPDGSSESNEARTRGRPLSRLRASLRLGPRR